MCEPVATGASVASVPIQRAKIFPTASSRKFRPASRHRFFTKSRARRSASEKQNTGIHHRRRRGGNGRQFVNLPLQLFAINFGSTGHHASARDEGIINADFSCAGLGALAAAKFGLVGGQFAFGLRQVGASLPQIRQNALAFRARARVNSSERRRNSSCVIERARSKWSAPAAGPAAGYAGLYQSITYRVPSACPSGVSERHAG